MPILEPAVFQKEQNLTYYLRERKLERERKEDRETEENPAFETLRAWWKRETQKYSLYRHSTLIQYFNIQTLSKE